VNIIETTIVEFIFDAELFFKQRGFLDIREVEHIFP